MFLLIKQTVDCCSTVNPILMGYSSMLGIKGFRLVKNFSNDQHQSYPYKVHLATSYGLNLLYFGKT